MSRGMRARKKKGDRKVVEDCGRKGVRLRKI